MAAIVTRRQRTTQPQRATLVAQSALTLGLALAVNPGAGIVDLAQRRQAASLGGITRAGGLRAMGLRAASNASTGVQFAGSRMSTSNGAGTGDFTYLVIANPIASSTREFFVCCQNGAQEFYFGANFVTGLGASAGTVNAQTNSGGASGISVAGAADGKLHTYVYTRSGATGSLYVDGALGGSSMVFQTQMWSSSSSDYIGGYSGSGWGISNGVFLVLAWNRALSAQEVASVSANPWQVFKAPARRLWLAYSSGTSNTGTIATMLAGAALSASGQVVDAGSFASTLAGASLAASGLVASPPSGSLASTLSGASMAAAGSVTNAGALASALAGTTMSAAGTVTNRGAIASQLDGAVLAASGNVIAIPAGALASALDGAALAAGGYVGTPPAGPDFFIRLPKNPRHVIHHH